MMIFTKPDYEALGITSKMLGYASDVLGSNIDKDTDGKPF